MSRRTASVVVIALTLLGARSVYADSHVFSEAVDAYLSGDYATALPLLRELSEHGDPPAQYLLAELYLTGSGVRRNATAAAFWLHKASLADYPAAQYRLGVMLDEGIGLEPDPAVAASLLAHAAKRGDAPARRRAEIMHAPASSDQNELERAGDLAAANDLQAAFLYRLRVARRAQHAAQYQVGVAYLVGEGTVRDPDLALTWLRNAAAGGEVRAQALLGSLLEDGPGIAHDSAEARAWRGKAAQQADGDAAAAAARAVLQRMQW